MARLSFCNQHSVENMTLEWLVTGPVPEQRDSGMRSRHCVYIDRLLGLSHTKLVFDDPDVAHEHMKALDKAVRAAVSVEVETGSASTVLREDAAVRPRNKRAARKRPQEAAV